jgi:hypothetical protein
MGCSTYGNDFKKFRQKVRPSSRPSAQDAKAEPFQGSSEYRLEYLDPGLSAHEEDMIYLGREKEDLEIKDRLTDDAIRAHAANESGRLPKLVDAVN